MNHEIKFYWNLFVARLPIMVAIFVVFSAVGVGVSLTLPAKYRASAVLLVESAQIPDRLAASTVTTPSQEQLEIIEQRLLRRANMVDLANEFGVFEEEERMSPDEVVREMRTRTGISRSLGRNRATLMTISFESSSAFTAASIVNEMTSLVLNEDAVRRQEAAEETLSFFEQEVERLNAALAQRSADIVAFKASNSASLPENSAFKLNRQSLLQNAISDANSQLDRLETQRNRVVQLGTTAFGNTAVSRSAAEIELDAVESELAQAKLVFSDTNPRVKVLEARAGALQARVAEERGTTVEDVDPTRSVLDLQLSEIDEQVERLNEVKDRAAEELEELEVEIQRIPQVAIRLEALEREYQNTQSRYNAAANNLALAQTGERIETLAKGQRITVIEQAVPPTEPTSPNRLLIAGGGVFAGLGLAAAFFMLAELLNRAIRRPSDLVSALGVQPLATIPYLETKGARRRKRFALWVVVLIIATGVPVALWYLHYNYMPLDLLFRKVLERFGI